MKSWIIIFLLLINSGNTFSQEINAPLNLRNGFFGWQFYRGEQKLKPREVAELLQADVEAAKLFSKGRSSYTVSTIIGSIGGAMLGYTLGTYLGGGDANWTVGGIGAGLTVVALPLSISATSKVRKALVLYNDRQRTGTLPNHQWKLMLTGNQLGLVCRF